MERCPNCGNKLNKIDVLCPRCGSVVEVIQIKGNISAASEAAAENKPKDPKTIQKKDFPQSFIVYNEDFPAEDSGDIEPAALPDKPILDASDAPYTESFSANVTDADALEQPQQNSIRMKLFEKTQAEEKELFDEDKIVPAEKNTPNIINDDDNDYSPRYLENLKNLNLPEIDDLSSFDPEEYMREYKYRKILNNQAASDSSAVPAKKQWLEIEETDSGIETELAKVREDVQAQSTPEPIVERRYRGVQESQPEKKQETARIAAKQSNVEGKRPKKLSALSMVLFWVVVSAAIFFCGIFFDNYVKSSFGTYDSFIYSITNGQIDIDPNNP